MIKLVVLKGLNKSKKLSFLVLILIIIIAVIAITTFSKSKQHQQVKGDTSLNLEKIIASGNIQEFVNLTRQLGPPKTYELLKKTFPNNDTAAHDFAHVVGIVAHDQKGMENLKVCDTAYNYGCYHGFIEAFIAKNTVAKVSGIEEGCVALGAVHAPSCLHGIGHGVMVDASYNLDKALENCSILKQTSQVYCWDGVFMERIVGSMLADRNRYALSANTLFEPCNSIGAIYKEQCWRNQVSAWFQFFAGQTKDVGNQCSQVEYRYQKTCFESLGLLTTIKIGENAQMLIAACQVLLASPARFDARQAGGPQNQISDDCLIGAIKELLFEGKQASIAQSLCSAVSIVNRDYCLQVFNDHLAQSQTRFGR